MFVVARYQYCFFKFQHPQYLFWSSLMVLPSAFASLKRVDNENFLVLDVGEFTMMELAETVKEVTVRASKRFSFHINQNF